MAEEKKEGEEQATPQDGGEEKASPQADTPLSDASTEGEVKKAQFSTLTSEQKDQKPIDIKFLMDISLELTIELGRRELSFRDVLLLKDGVVVELNKLAGDPVDIFVNNKLIARGEVVVIDDNFGVRVTDILSPTELINNLKNSAKH